MVDHIDGFVDVRGKKTRYARGGEGPTLVYLHSAAGETSLFGSPWLPFIDRLAQDFDVVSTVHPGFGDSEGLDQIDDMIDLVLHYCDFWEVLGIERAHVVGLSLGGWLGAEIAVLYPDMVDRLVLTDAVGLQVPEHPISEIFGRMPSENAHLMFHRPENHPLGAVMLAMEGQMESGLPKGVDPETILPTIRALAATAKVGWNPYLHDPRLPRRLHRVVAPTMALWGAEDSLVSAFYADEYARYIADCKVVKVPDVGHMLPLEAEDTFVAEVTAFLS